MPTMSLPSGWQSYRTDDGKEYFHHVDKNLTQWDRPAAEPSNNPLASPLPPANALDDLLSMDAAPTTAHSAISTSPIRSNNNSNTTSAKTANNNSGFSGGGITNPQMISLDPVVNDNAGFSVARDLESGGGQQDSRPDLGLPNIWGLQAMITMLQDGPFNVTTDDVKERMLSIAIPNPANGRCDGLRERPDFWGPFWIATTCCIFFAGTANFTATADTDWGIVGTAAILLYGSLICLPLAHRAALFAIKEGSGEIPYFALICVFGYSLLPMLPVSLLCCIIYMGFARWVICCLGLAWSVLFYKNQLLEDIQNATPAPWFPFIVPAFQTLVYIFYRCFFLEV